MSETVGGLVAKYDVPVPREREATEVQPTAVYRVRG